MTITISNLTNANAVDTMRYDRYLADSDREFIQTTYGEYMLIGGGVTNG